MKQEKTKKSKLWIWLAVGLAALLAVTGVVLALVLPADQGNADAAANGKLYWNIDKEFYTKDSDIGLSTREPGEDGLYHVRFAVDGQQVELPVVGDKKLINYMDTMGVLGIVQDSDGVVIDVVAPETVATEMAEDYFVRSADDRTIVINSSKVMNGMELTVNVSENTGIYDVDPDADPVGQTGQCDVLDQVTVYADASGEVTHVFIIQRADDAKVYWRLDRYYDSSRNKTTREPDENGVYTIPFVCDTEYVELKCRDEDLVATIDSSETTQCEMALVLDEEGYIVKLIDTAMALKGKEGCYNYDIVEMNGSQISTERLLAGKAQGSTYSASVPEDCKIYLVCNGGTAEKLGEPTQLQLNDRIICYTDMDGKPILIFVTRRMVDSPMYFNSVRKYSGGETTRTPDEDGYYVFDMAANGGPVTLRTKDKAIASQVDSYTARCMGLKVNGDIIEKVYSPSCVCGWGLMATERYVTSLSGTIVTLTSSTNSSSTTNCILSEKTEIYDVSNNYGVKFGEKTTLKLDDRATVYRSSDGTVSHVFIVSRYESDAKVYYNLSRQYSASRKETTRTPDGNNYYVFDMVCEGKQVTVRTKSKEMASFIDAQNAPIVGLKVSGGIIQNAYLAATAVKNGYKDLNYNYVSKVNADGTFNAYYISGGVRKERAATYKLAKDCKIYNVSPGYISYKGEPTTLQVDDRIQAIATKPSGEIVQIYVVEREVASPLYWKTEQKYNSSTGETTRTQDAEGYYVFDLAVNGQIKQYKTKDKDLASRIDAMGLAFALRTNGNIIEQVYGPLYAEGIKALPVSNYDVMAINGTKVTVQRNRPEATDFGQTMELKFAKNCKIYNVSSYAESFGAVIKLELGDRIACYTNENDEVIYCFIRNEHTRKAGSVSYCEHCQQEVFWEPFVSTVYETDAHYYLTHDRNLTKQLTLGSAETVEKYDVVFDLNGFTLASTKRSFLTYVDLSIMDSVGTGRIVTQNTGAGIGGNLMVAGKAVLNIYGGTFTLAEDAVFGRQGGVLYAATADNVINMYGGIITGGQVKPAEDGSAAEGGNVYVTRGTFHFYGGIISGGTAQDGYGGNVFVRNNNAKFNMYGGTITGGQAARGSNVYVTGGTDAAATMTMSGGEIGGDVVITSSAAVRLEGKPVIKQGALYGLSLPEGLKLSLGALTEGTEVAVSATDVFTEVTDKAEVYKTYFKPMMEGDTIIVKDGALAYQLAQRQVNEELHFDPGTTNAMCVICGEKVTWTAITQAANGETAFGNAANKGHYYLAEDITYTGSEATFFRAPSTGQTACLHLNGHDLTTTGTATRPIVGYAGVLNMMGNGTVSGNCTVENQGATVHTNTNKESGMVNLYGGTYTKAASNTTASVIAIWNNGGRINLYEGAKVVNPYGGYSIYTGKTSLIDTLLGIYGATVESGDVYLLGATTQDHTSTLILESAKIASGVKVSANNQVTLCGTPELAGLELAAGVKLTLGELTEDASVTVSAAGAFTEPNEKAAEYAKCFKPATAIGKITHKDNVLYCEKEYNGALQFTEGTNALCPACEKEVFWKVLSADAAVKLAAGDHYYLSDAVTYSGTDAFITAPGSGSTACLHLNGKALTASNARAIYGNAGTLNVMGAGKVSGNFYAASGSNSHRGAAVDLHNATGILNLYGGTYVKPASNTVNPVITADSNGGTINLYEGAVVDGTGTSGVTVKSLYGIFCLRGGKIICGDNAAIQANNWTTGKTGKLEMYSGEIIGEVKLTGSANDKATFLWAGGTVTGKVSAKHSRITLGGDAGIAGEGNLLELYATSLLTVREDFTGAATVWFEGVTDTVPEANGVSQGAYTGALVLKDSGAKVVGQDGKLVISE